MKEIKLKIECPSCNGTGVYTGMGERDGASIVCYKCNGTGCYDYSYKYNDFVERKKRDDVKRVYLSGYGWCISPKALDLKKSEGGTIFVDFTKEGVSYAEFLDGKMPKHIKTLGCPMMADQGACHKIKGFTEKCNDLNGGWVGHIPSCKYNPNMVECWKRFEEE